MAEYLTQAVVAVEVVVHDPDAPPARQELADHV